jgi:hypothetical protein
VLLGTESNAKPDSQFDPYIGDYFDLTSVGNNFYGTFSASNLDDGTNATLNSATTFLRKFSGTPGTANFQLTDTTGMPIAGSIDPYVCIDYPGQSSSPLAGCVDYPARHV